MVWVGVIAAISNRTPSSMSEPTAKVGPYSLTECLESGSAVQLWLAENQDEVVAIRLVVDPSDELAVSRWQGELDFLQSLDHASIPGVLAVFQDEKAFAFSWLEGVGLEEMVAARAAGSHELSPGAVVRLALAIVDALQTLGEGGTIHGNLSPERIRFSTQGAVQLSGWGVRPERVQPRYMAPEMTGEGEVSLQTDQWYVAVLMFELLMGRALYVGDWGEVFKQALDGNNSEACAALKQAYPRLSPPILKALRFEDSQGFESHSDLIEALSSVLLAVGAGPNLPQVIAVFQQASGLQPSVGFSEPSLSESAPVLAPQLERVEINLPDPVAEEATPAEEVPVEDLPVEEVPAEETLSPEPLAEPVLPASILPVPLEEMPSALDSAEVGFVEGLGQALTAWERAELACCEAALPVERGSWWVSRGGETTSLPQALVAPTPAILSVSEPEPVVEFEPVLESGRELRRRRR